MTGTGRDRKLDELAEIEFTSPLGQAFTRYARTFGEVAHRWDTELGLAAADARAVLGAAKTPAAGTDSGDGGSGFWRAVTAPHVEAFLWLISPAQRRVKAARVARRLTRAQALIAVMARRVARLPREYAHHFAPLHQAEQADRKAIETSKTSPTDGKDGGR